MGVKKKRNRYKKPKFNKALLIVKQIKELNTEPHIFRYKTLYNIYNALYLATYQKPLSILNYYIEDDGFLIAEIKGTEMLYLKDRIKAHIKLLREIRQGVKFEHTKKIKIVSDSFQISLFS